MDGLAFYTYEYLTAASELLFGSVAPGSSDDDVMRIVNIDTQYVANDVTVRVQAASADADQLWVSVDGDSFAESVDIGDLPPGSASPPVWIRRVTPAATANGAKTGAIEAFPASWTLPDAPVEPAFPVEDE